MEDHYVLDNGTPVLRVQQTEPLTILKVDGAPDWVYDFAEDSLVEKQDLTLSQLVRLMGRNAGSMTMNDYEAAKRRVTKRGDEVIGDDGEVSLTASGEILKTDPAQQIVFGWAYAVTDKDGQQVIDKSGDFIDQVEEIEKSAYDYVLSSRASDADHSNVKGGSLVESIVFTPEKIEKMGIPEGVVPMGWWVGYKIEDKKTWERVEKGELVAFSIHGSGTRTKVAPE